MTSEPVGLLQELIRNACVNDGTPESGYEHRSVETLLDFFGVEGEIFEPAPGRQSLVYRIAGVDPDAPALALVPHLDVVPVDPEGWSRDPFAGDIVDGFVFGRGAVDMLNVTAALAWAVRPYVRGDLQSRRDLVFAAVADEEAGGVHGASALVEQRWDLVAAEYVLTEVAYPKTTYSSTPAVPVTVGEKGVFWSILRTGGRPGHGSAPYGSDNALAKLVEALYGILQAPLPVGIIPEWAELVESLDLDPFLKEALTDPDRVDDAIDELAVTDPLFARYAHALTHLTLSPTEARAGVKANVIPNRARTSLDIRALPGMDRDFIDSHLRKSMGAVQDEVDIEPFKDTEATISGRGNPLWEAIADSVEDLEGHRSLMPTLMTVGTDGRFWRKKGAIAYGVGLFDDRMSFTEMLSWFHGHDERVTVASVDRTASLYERVLHHFCGP